MTTSERAPKNWPSDNVDPDTQRRVAEVTEELSHITIDARGTLGRRRAADAHRYALDLLRGLASSAVLRTGQELEGEDVLRLVNDYLVGETIPTSLRADVKAVAVSIIEQIASGDRKGADDQAREAAIGLGERLAKSAWSGPPEPENPTELARQVPR